jgi:hypothetical protein
MDLATFQGLLEQCGTDLETWPDGDGDAALELMASSAEARDAYLAAFPGPDDRPQTGDANDALVERIMQGVVRSGR